MAGLSTNPRVKGAGWEAVDGLLAEIEQLAEGTLAADDFYAQMFQRLQSLGCRDAAVWVVENGEEEAAPTVAWRAVGLRGSATHAHEEMAERSVVQSVIESGDGRWVDASGDAERSNGNGSSQLGNGAAARTNVEIAGHRIIAPWRTAEGRAGALEVWRSGALAGAAAEGYVRLFQAVGELLGGYQSRLEQRKLRRHVQLQKRIDELNQRLHESLDLDKTAYCIANDARMLVECDRVSVAIRRGGRYRVLAVSGAEHVHRRSESMRQLERLCGRVALAGQALWYRSAAAAERGGRGDELLPDWPPQVSQALTEYLDLSPALGLALLPLAAPQGEPHATVKPIGALVFEDYAKPLGGETRGVIESIVGHCRLALWNALRMRAIPAHRFWLAIGREGWLAKVLSRSVLVGIAVAGVIAALVMIPAEVRIQARGELQPTVRAEVFAPRDGVVTAVHIDHGQEVEKDDKLLEMRSPELDLEVQRVQGELETTRKRLAAATSERLQTRPGDPDARLRQRRLTAEEEQLQQEVAALAQRQKLLGEQIQELTIKSPLRGDVVTWNLEQQLAARPLRRGDALLTVADVSGPWQLELHVPSRQAGRLLRGAKAQEEGQAVDFVLTTDPGTKLSGTVREIAHRVETDEAGESYVVVTVDVPREAIERRVPGATAVGRIACGQSTLGVAWFHELWDAVLLWMPF